jgi:hypothetical protein
MDLSNPLIKIKKWFGRLGNNIYQLLHAIKIALYYKSTVVFPLHPYFNTTTIEVGNNKVYSCTIEDEFYFKNKVNIIDQSLFSMNEEESIALLRKCFVIDVSTVPALGPTDLVIHIRSGDIFKGDVHHGYTPLPVSHYAKIITQNSFKNVYLVAEDRRNPVINSLLKLFPYIKFKLQKLREDILLILGAKYIAASIGSFIPTLTMLSTNSPYIFSPYSAHFQAYYTLLGKWENKKKQYTILLTYEMTDEDSYYKILS